MDARSHDQIHWAPSVPLALASLASGSSVCAVAIAEQPHLLESLITIVCADASVASTPHSGMELRTPGASNLPLPSPAWSSSSSGTASKTPGGSISSSGTVVRIRGKSADWDNHSRVEETVDLVSFRANAILTLAMLSNEAAVNLASFGDVVRLLRRLEAWMCFGDVGTRRNATMAVASLSCWKQVSEHCDLHRISLGLFKTLVSSVLGDNPIPMKCEAMRALANFSAAAPNVVLVSATPHFLEAVDLLLSTATASFASFPVAEQLAANSALALANLAAESAVGLHLLKKMASLG